MTLLEQLQKIETVRVWGIAECFQKNLLLERMIRAYRKKKMPVVVAHTGTKKMPPAGTIIIGKNIPVVCSEIQEVLETPEVVVIGKRIANSRLEGFTFTEMKKILRTLPDYPFLLELPCEPPENALLPAKEVKKCGKASLWDQLVVSMPVSVFLERLQNGEKSFKPETALQEAGLLSLFQQQWPAVFILTGVQETRDENQAMLLIREMKRYAPEFTVGLYKTANNAIHWVE